MKKLLLLTILFVCAAPLQATTIQMTNPSIATIVIPDGSTITSAIYEPPGNTQTGRWIIDFTFAGGHGQEWDDYNDGGQGWIGFDAPVSNLSINWFSTGVFDMGPTFRSCMNIFLGCPNHGTFDFSGPTTGFSWSIYFGGFGGVSSMSYTDPEQVPADIICTAADWTAGDRLHEKAAIYECRRLRFFCAREVQTLRTS